MGHITNFCYSGFSLGVRMPHHVEDHKNAKPENLPRWRGLGVVRNNHLLPGNKEVLIRNDHLLVRNSHLLSGNKEMLVRNDEVPVRNDRLLQKADKL